MNGHRRVLPVIALLVISGCASVPRDYPRTQSFAVEHPEQTGMGGHLQPQLAEHPGLSAFHLLPAALDAYVARLLLIDAAHDTLDMQYFMFEDDLTGKLLAARLLAAADRGVRVRLLVDDWAQTGKDHYLAKLATHPKIEARIYNPIGGCGDSRGRGRWHTCSGRSASGIEWTTRR